LLDKISLVALLLLAISGCATGLKIEPFNASTELAALDEIAARRRLFDNAVICGDMKLSSASGEINLRFDLTVTQHDRWRVRFEGPLGVDIAMIEASAGRFTFTDLQHGEMIVGYVDEPADIPGIGLEMLPLSLMLPLLLPVTDIAYPQDWTIEDNPQPLRNTLHLQSVTPTLVDRLEIELDYFPLSVWKESGYSAKAMRYEKLYHYENSDDVSPDRVTIKFDNITFNISYRKVKLLKPVSQIGVKSIL
jgi:hypothetical protein